MQALNCIHMPQPLQLHTTQACADNNMHTGKSKGKGSPVIAKDHQGQC